MKSKKGYIKGMVQDNSSSKFPEESYFEIRNFRVVTEEGSSLGSLENEKGHILGFTVPNIPQTTYTQGTNSFTIPAQNDLRIVGWTAVNDLVVIATTNETSATPSGAISQIWAFTFNEATGEVINSLANNTLDIDEHLVYNRELNLSTEYRVKMVGRYETADIIRVYFTDNYNPIRTLNIQDPNIQFVEPNILDLESDVNFIQPVIEAVGNGNLPEGTQIQASYRLLSNTGAVTLYAPPSPLLPLPASPYSSPIEEFSGDGNIGNNTKSATFSFTNLDTRYDVIEFIAIVYADLNVATVYKIDESAIPSSGNITKIYSDLNTATVIPLEFYNILSFGFKVAKDIEVKDNLLLAANTKGQSAILDFDARAYRWDDNSTFAKIQDVSNNVDLFIDTNGDIYDDVMNPAIGTWEDIPEDHDCINPYNKLDSVNFPDWNSNQQYKFQRDLVTLGGEGPNVSYKFVTETCIASTKMPHYPLPGGDSLFRFGTVPHVNVGLNPGVTLNTGIEIDELGTLQTYNTDNQLFNFASHTYNCYFAGHTRGEVYRYGICFYDKKGSVKFVNWIGDIRIPEAIDGFPIMTRSNTHGGTQEAPWLRTLGIEFTVDVSSIASEISGFSFVRVLRDATNRTRLGSGMLMWFETRFANDTGNTIIDYGDSSDYEDDIWTGFRKSRGLGVSRSTESRLEIFGSSPQRCTIVRETPGWGSAARADATPNKRCHTYLVSPLGRELEVEHKPQDYIKTTGYYVARCHNFGLNSGTNQNNSRVGFIYMLTSLDLSNAHDIPHQEELIYIRYARSLNNGEVVSSGVLNNILNEYGLTDRMVNAGLGVPSDVGLNFDTWTPFGIGTKKLCLILDKDASSPGFVNPVTGMQLYNPDENELFSTDPASVHRIPRWEASQGTDNNYFSSNVVPFKEVQYCRFINNQYGGDSFSARSQNEYYFIGHFQPFINGKTSYTNKVFLGDTFVNYYDQELTVAHTSQDMISPNPFNEVGTERNLLTTSIICPVESPINTELRPRQQFAKRRQPNHIQEPTFNFSLTSYKLVYLNRDIVTRKYFAPDFIQSGSDEHPNRVWYSDIKVNGEFSDSWRNFMPANYREVDGVLGEINKIINWKGVVYFYQNRGFGRLLINERSLITDSSGSELTLGTGQGISDHVYISNDTGAIHQYGVAKSINALYHYDARLKKVYRFSGEGLEAISDSKGMSAFFDNNVSGRILAEDKTLSELGPGPVGIEAVFDYRYNRVIFTFIGNKTLKEYNSQSTYFPGDIIYGFDEDNFEVIQEVNFTQTTIANALQEGLIKVLRTRNSGFTITFSEMINAWEGFYDFIPGMYLQYGRRLISRSPFDNNRGYIHNQGTYCNYYGNSTFNSKLLTKLGVHGDFTKIFNNVEYYGQITQNNVDVPFETFDTVRVYNDYQDTGTQENTNGNLIKRRMRTFRHIIQRDVLSQNSKARIRNPWTFLELGYINNNNKKHIVHDITYSFTPSRD